MVKVGDTIFYENKKWEVESVSSNEVVLKSLEPRSNLKKLKVQLVNIKMEDKLNEAI